MDDNDKPKETHEDRFRRISEKRVRNVLLALHRLSKCSNRGSYAFTEEQVERMFAAIENTTGGVRKTFESRVVPEFSWDESGKSA